MKCDHCGQDLAQGARKCDQCGTAVREPEKKPINGAKLAALIFTGVLVVALIVGLVWALARPAQNDPLDDPQSTVDGTDTTEDTMDPAEALAAHPVLIRDAYTGEAGDTAALTKSPIQVGDVTVTNSQLAIWYWQTYYDLLNQLGYYASYYGLDTTQPLGEQTCPMTEVEMTWEQFILENALNNCHSYQAMYQEALANDITLSQEDQETLDNLETDLTATAQQYGFETVEAMFESDYGTGITLEDYKAFVETLLVGNTYYNHMMETLEPTDEEVDAYFKENQTTLEESGIYQDGSPASMNVRHILIQYEDLAQATEETEETEATEGTEGTDATEATVSEEEQMEACRVEAQRIYDLWKAGEATEESFAELANEFSSDGGSNTNGGLYEDVTPGQMVETFNDWCFDPSRQVGDTGLVETDYGVHIMYFVSASETEYWYSQCQATILSQRLSQLVDELMAQYKLNVNYQEIHLTPVIVATEY